MASVRVDIDIPHRLLGGNAGTIPPKASFIRRKERDDQKSSAFFQASEQRPAQPWPVAVVWTVLRVKKANDVWDDDNLFTGTKFARDGIVEAGVVGNDRNMRLMPVVRQIGPEEVPGVTIVVAPGIIDFDGYGPENVPLVFGARLVKDQ